MSRRALVGEIHPEGREPIRSASITIAWVPERDLDLAEWSRAGQRLGTMNRCSPWWLGDWIRYGNAKFGEKYSRSAKITGYDVQTLMNMVYVASRFEISRRRENLSWSHHEAVASLNVDDQAWWLDQAIEHRLSVADLRLVLRSRPKDQEGPPGTVPIGGTADESPDMCITCPNCGYSIPPRVLTGVPGESGAPCLSASVRRGNC
jgi:hypothetical protein